jgi:hypothetical protein
METCPALHAASLTFARDSGGVVAMQQEYFSTELDEEFMVR